MKTAEVTITTEPRLGPMDKMSAVVALQKSQLIILAEAVLSEHSETCDFCPYTMNEPDCKESSDACSKSGCFCVACATARTVIEAQNKPIEPVSE